MVPLSNTKTKRNLGGPAYHREGCTCNPCKARRRKEEALARANGAGRVPLDAYGRLPEGKVIDADHPLVVSEFTDRDFIAQWIALRYKHPTLTNPELAQLMGIHVRTLHRHIQKAIREGWLKFSDPLSRIEHEIIPKTLDNVSRFLDEGDKTVTIEAFKSTIARQYQEAKGISEAPQTILALKIETADLSGEGPPKVITGQIVGAGKALPE